MKIEFDKAKRGSALKGIVIGMAAGIGAILLGAMILAWLVQTQKIDESTLGYGILIVTASSVFTGCVVGAKKSELNRLVSSTSVSILMFAALICLNAMLFEGRYQGIGVTLLLITGCCISTALIGVNKKRRVKTRHKMRATG